MQHLKGINVLVTRPVQQAENLCTLVAAAGGQAIRLPTMAIESIEDKSALQACAANLATWDFAIFVSVNAVEQALPTLLLHGPIPAHLKIMAIGRQTAKVLGQFGVAALCPFPPFNSEALLAMPQLQAIQNKKVVIFRGDSGRKLLAETLKQRGADVTCISVYQRIPLSPPVQPLPPIDVVTVTSVESLHHLLTMLVDQAWLTDTPLVVMSQRIGQEATRLGLQGPIEVATVASDEGLLQAIAQAIIPIPPLP